MPNESLAAPAHHRFRLQIEGDKRDIVFDTLAEAENALSGLVRPGQTISIVDRDTNEVVKQVAQQRPR